MGAGFDRQTAAARALVPITALSLLLLSWLASCAGDRARGRVTAPEGPPAPRGVPSLHLLLTIEGERKNGELGFRFGSPRDLDGDGIADIAAGARFTDLAFTQMGTVGVWSSAGGKRLAGWDGQTADALFGHSVLIGPDIDGDRRPDIIASAPAGKYAEVYRGAIRALSAASGRELWSVRGEPGEALGWQLALAGDQNRDGVEDLFAGAPGNGARGMAYLLDGRTGAVLHAYPSPAEDDQFGWYVSTAPDLDGDGLADLLVGAPSTTWNGAPRAGAAYAISSATGRRLREFRGTEANGQFGEMVAVLGDFDGDGHPEVAISATFHPNLTRDESKVGEVTVYSGASGEEIRRFRGRQGVELYGRMIAPAGDVDGDGVGDIAIGAPWSRVGDLARAGRFEVRSGRTGEILLEVSGDRAEMWLGWHIAAAEDLGTAKEKGLVVSALRSEEGGLVGAGALRVYVLRTRS
jgi:FG-GAP repeat protein